MGSDRSPQRIALSLKKGQVRYYNGEHAYRKTRSERTIRRKKKVHVIVDVSLPPLPFIEPTCCVKLAVHHGAAAFYTNYVLRCDATCYCNELCDFVCGRPTNFNNSNAKSNYSRAVSTKETSFLDVDKRPKSHSCDSGFEELAEDETDENIQEKDAEFVNIDVYHLSVWYCRTSPPGPEDLEVVRSSLHQVPSESATESECTGPPNKVCFKWHREWEKSSLATRSQRKKILKETGALLQSLSRELKSKKELPAKKTLLKPFVKNASPHEELNLVQVGKTRSKLNSKRRSNTLPLTFSTSSSLSPMLAHPCTSETRLEQRGVSGYESEKDGCKSDEIATDDTHSSVLQAIHKNSLGNTKKNIGRSPSFRVDV